MAAILADLNAVCGSKYKHNWPSVMAKREYSLDRCPTVVRRYMMQVVLTSELKALGVKVTDDQLASMIVRLT